MSSVLSTLGSSTLSFMNSSSECVPSSTIASADLMGAIPAALLSMTMASTAFSDLKSGDYKEASINGMMSLGLATIAINRIANFGCAETFFAQACVAAEVLPIVGMTIVSLMPSPTVAPLLPVLPLLPDPIL
jgi:hypothetical protein